MYDDPMYEEESFVKQFWRAHKAAILLVATPLILFVCLVLITPPVWKLKSSPVTVKRWVKKKGEIEAVVGPKQPDWIRVKTVSKHVLYAIIVSEDGRFYSHNGLDFAEIINSLALNLKKGRYARGGSTISQQVVKTAFLTREKSLLRKGREAIGAALMEQLLTKDEILEWYINLVEFGDGIYGIKAAAKHYYNTKPELLTIEQGANLALVLPSPNAWSQGLRRRRLTPFGHRRYAKIITNMRLAGYITETLWLHALATGDFGRPVHAYEKALARVNARSHRGLSETEAEQLENALEKGIESLPEETLETDQEFAADAAIEKAAEEQARKPQEAAPQNAPAPADGGTPDAQPMAAPEAPPTEGTQLKETPDGLVPSVDVEQLPDDSQFLQEE